MQIKKLIKNNLPFILFILFMFSFRSSVADWYHVPSGSMEPTIQVGDRVVVDKSAYTLKLPFTNVVIVNTGDIERGDIVIIDSTAADTRLIKRVIAIEDDTVQLKDNHLVINGEYASLTQLEGSQLKEQILGHHRSIALASPSSPISSFQQVKVPKDHILAMGDNRNNSLDSRYYGFFPIAEIQGRARSVAFSVDKDNRYLPRTERFFKPLQ
ncbi:signal peptidase I [Alteromonas sp. D210916BOD_24]|uniref:signal peptidase I n=1 Tax=Alteromonas sp. D210916BOD_24 TaxID=3157618 RepID=UPI00399C91F3